MSEFSSPLINRASPLRNLKAYILCHQAQINPLYRDWCSRVNHEVVGDYDLDWSPPEDCGVLISHLHYDSPTAPILKRIFADNQIPVLVLADGILEFRNNFLNPLVSAGSLFMPVQGHKIACIGNSQARQIAAWGNAGKVEVVGLPRLDEYRGSAKINLGNEDASKPLRVLIVTARRPGFTERQMQEVKQSLVDLRNWFQQNPYLGKRELQPIWRLTGDLAPRIGVSPENSGESQPIRDILQTVQAVISTPSTTLVESMLMDLPTAIIDYTNSPKYLTGAWNITASEHVPRVLPDLLSPSTAHLDFQRNAIADAVQMIEPAGDRMVKLIESLMTCRKNSLATSGPLNVPQNILGHSTGGVGESGETESLKAVFPSQIEFRASEVDSLVTEKGQLNRSIQCMQQIIDQQRNEISSLRQKNRMSQRGLEFVSDKAGWLKEEIKRLQLALRISRRPSRTQRRIRLHASLAFQRWEFFYQQLQNRNLKRNSSICLDRLFELTGFPKDRKIPPTVATFNRPKTKNLLVKMWKFRPVNPLLKRMSRSVTVCQKRLKIRRVMKAGQELT